MSVQYRGIEFESVNAGHVFLGTEKGGWMYGSQRPRHEVQCPRFLIMKAVVSQPQVQMLLDTKQEEVFLNGERIEQICLDLTSGLDPIGLGLDTTKAWAVSYTHLTLPTTD